MSRASMMLEELNIVKEILEDDRFKTLTKNQINELKERFNLYVNFEYCEDGGYIFIMSKNNFSKFEYYTGMEYEKDNIETLINLGDDVLVIYSYDCERAEELISYLEENE